MNAKILLISLFAAIVILFFSALHWPGSSHNAAFTDGLMLVENGDLTEARAKFNQYIQSDQYTVRCLVAIGSTYAVKGDYQSALPYFEVGRALGSQDSLKYIAHCYLQMKQWADFSKLLPALKRKADIDPEVALLIVLYSISQNDKQLFLDASGLIQEDYLKTSPQNLDVLIKGCEIFNLEDQRRKYLAVRTDANNNH